MFFFFPLAILPCWLFIRTMKRLLVSRKKITPLGPSCRHWENWGGGRNSSHDFWRLDWLTAASMPTIMMMMMIAMTTFESERALPASGLRPQRLPAVAGTWAIHVCHLGSKDTALWAISRWVPVSAPAGNWKRVGARAGTLSHKLWCGVQCKVKLDACPSGW